MFKSFTYSKVFSLNSSYETVQVTDEDTVEIKAFLIDVYMMERDNLNMIKKDILQLEENGVKCYFDHFLPLPGIQNG